MPAIMDDPSSPTLHRVSGPTPYPDPDNPALPTNIHPRQVVLRDRQTVASIVPFVSREQVPSSLLRYLCDQFAKEIEGGDTYPMIDPMSFDKFSAYWLQNFAGVMLLGKINSPDEVVEGKDWSKECLGSFYIKPNYPGRSSHVCNAGFLVTDASRNRGVGRLMGETYLDWAPKLGYTYSVFNLVYDTNVASCKIWDALGFKRIGRVKGCGNLKSYPDRLVDAIIYGRELGTGAGEGGDSLLVSEERFDKIKFYLKYGRYPNGSDRAEKSRLRSAATHYKLLDNDVLMLKGKEVISDHVRQSTISKKAHEDGGHAGINKTTATIAEKYHWSRIKETVSDVIKLCDQCKDSGKDLPPTQNQNLQTLDNIARRYNNVNNLANFSPNTSTATMSSSADTEAGEVEVADRILDLQPSIQEHELPAALVGASNPYANPGDISTLLNPPVPTSTGTGMGQSHHSILHSHSPHDSMAATTLISLHNDRDIYHPIDPQILSQQSHQHHRDPYSNDPEQHHFDTFNPRDAVALPQSTHHASQTPLSVQQQRMTYSNPNISHDPATISQHEYASFHAHSTAESPMRHHYEGQSHEPHRVHDSSQPEQESFQALLHDDLGEQHMSGVHSEDSDELSRRGNNQVNLTRSPHLIASQNHHEDVLLDQDELDMDMLIEQSDDDDDYNDRNINHAAFGDSHNDDHRRRLSEMDAIDVDMGDVILDSSHDAGDVNAVDGDPNDRNDDMDRTGITKTAAGTPHFGGQDSGSGTPKRSSIYNIVFQTER